MSSRTVLRRRQREHHLQCLAIGARQRIAHAQEVEEMRTLLGSHDACVLLSSVATHRSDCKQLGVAVHHSSMSNRMAYMDGSKSRAVHKQHQRLHQQANIVKHDTSLYISAAGVLTPADGVAHGFPQDPAIVAAYKGTPSVQFFTDRPTANGFHWNLQAPEFVPEACQQQMLAAYDSDVSSDCDCYDSIHQADLVLQHLTGPKHWLDSLPVDVLDKLHRADSSLFDYVDGTPPRHLQSIIDEWVVECAGCADVGRGVDAAPAAPSTISMPGNIDCDFGDDEFHIIDQFLNRRFVKGLRGGCESHVMHDSDDLDPTEELEEIYAQQWNSISQPLPTIESRGICHQHPLFVMGARLFSWMMAALWLFILRPACCLANYQRARSPSSCTSPKVQDGPLCPRPTKRAKKRAKHRLQAASCVGAHADAEKCEMLCSDSVRECEGQQQGPTYIPGEDAGPQPVEDSEYQPDPMQVATHAGKDNEQADCSDDALPFVPTVDEAAVMMTGTALTNEAQHTGVGSASDGDEPWACPRQQVRKKRKHQARIAAKHEQLRVDAMIQAFRAQSVSAFDFVYDAQISEHLYVECSISEMSHRVQSLFEIDACECRDNDLNFIFACEKRDEYPVVVDMRCIECILGARSDNTN